MEIYVAMGCNRLLAIIFFIIITCSFLSCWQNAEGEVHVLPPEFTGRVYIIFNEENGVKTNYDEAGNRIYVIPKSGYLYTNRLVVA